MHKLIQEMDQNFEKDFRAGFEWLAGSTMEAFRKLPQFKHTEMVMPNGEIQRWWRGPGESIIITYKKDKES